MKVKYFIYLFAVVLVTIAVNLKDLSLIHI